MQFDPHGLRVRPPSRIATCRENVPKYRERDELCLFLSVTRRETRKRSRRRYESFAFPRTTDKRKDKWRKLSFSLFSSSFADWDVLLLEKEEGVKAKKMNLCKMVHFILPLNRNQERLRRIKQKLWIPISLSLSLALSLSPLSPGKILDKRARILIKTEEQPSDKFGAWGLSPVLRGGQGDISWRNIVHS